MNPIKFILIFMTMATCLCVSAQGDNFEKKEKVGEGLYKVMSHNRWGIVDDNNNLKLSLEYNEPVFMNGKAVITNFGTAQLAGIIDSAGNFKKMPPYFVDLSYPFVSEDMLAVRATETGDLGFINTSTGEMLNLQLKGFKSKNKFLRSLGITSKGLKGIFVFEFAAPFTEGVAAVYSPKTGWLHIDKNGQERFRQTVQEPTLFRSSVHKGECVIFGEKGIVVCKETPDNHAGIINYLEPSYEMKDYHVGLIYPYVIKSDSSRLYLNTRFQAEKYENLSRGDSVILIERPKVIPVVKTVEKKDSFELARDIRVELTRKAVSAGAKGTAAVTLVIKNTGQFDSGAIQVAVNIKGTRKSWSGVLTSGDKQEITLYIPARFASSSISREVSWSVKGENDEMNGSETVTIRRYKPRR